MATDFPWETGLAALLFAVTFLTAGRVHLLRALGMNHRRVISFSAGMSSAYVFVHLMPELHGARTALAESTPVELWYEGMGVYYLALVGFLSFYGLDHLRASRRSGGERYHEEQAYRIHVGGFAAYVALVSYLLVHNLEETPSSIVAFALAMTAHFLTVAHSLQEEHGEMFERRGRFVLAGMVAAGWGAALLFALSTHVLALLVSFVSGAVIMNSAVMELPSEKNGRFLPFMAGGLIYGALLLPLS
jgi:hypothetical protein